jgi:rusticyanin
LKTAWFVSDSSTAAGEGDGMADHILTRAIGLVIVCAAVVAACTTTVTRNAGSLTSRPAAAGSSSGSGGCRPETAMPMNTTSTDAQLGQLIGREAGTQLAGDAPLTVSDAQIAALGNRVPAGAAVDTCMNRLTFTGPAVSLVIEAVPAANPDMTFRIAGLVNPTVVVPVGARVRIEYINADRDEAHAFELTGVWPPFAFRPAVRPAFPGAAGGPLGDPTSAGHGAEYVTFTASAAGVYHYLCPMPGHAEMGMYANFVAR